MAEEKDKAWNYNVNEPYQLKLNQLVQQKKARADMLGKVLDIAGTAGAFALGGPVGAGLFNAAKKGVSGKSGASASTWMSGYAPGDQPGV